MNYLSFIFLPAGRHRAETSQCASIRVSIITARVYPKKKKYSVYFGSLTFLDLVRLGNLGNSVICFFFHSHSLLWIFGKWDAVVRKLLHNYIDYNALALTWFLRALRRRYLSILESPTCVGHLECKCFCGFVGFVAFLPNRIRRISDCKSC